MIEPALDVPAQVAVRDDPDKMTVAIDDAEHAKALGVHFDDRVVHVGVGAGQRHLLGAMHQALHRLEPRAQRATRMQPPEVCSREALEVHDSHRERVAEGQRHRGRRRRRHRFRPDFLPVRQQKQRGRRLGEHRLRAAGHADDRNVRRLEMLDDELELGRFAALRNEDRNVAFGRHAKVAVDRLRQVKEGRGRAGRCEGRRDLSRDMP